MGADSHIANVTVDPRAALLNKLSELQTSFSAAIADIAGREAALAKALDQVRDSLEDGLRESDLAPTHPLSGIVADFNAEFRTIVEDWFARIERYERNVTFRQRYADSLVVFVLGKVKAGKSSLGNYMAYERCDPGALAATSSTPRFFTVASSSTYDGADEASVAQGGFFRVGASETTHTIQGFRLPGLTWIDSPGLHSVTAENGALASGYVDVADLIIYPMHTGAPGRAGDIAEIRGLLAAKKRLLVLITQCDKVEEDIELDGTIVQSRVMKEPATRQGQLDYVRGAIAADGVPIAVDLISVSVRFAETHCNDRAALESSGVADLYRLLTQIAQSEGVVRKRETPSLNLDRLVGLLVGDGDNDSRLSVQHVLKKLDAMATRSAVAAEHLKARAEAVSARILKQIRPAVDAAIEIHAGDQDQAGFERACSEALLKIVSQETEEEVRALLAASSTNVPMSVIPPIGPMLKFDEITIDIRKSNRGFRAAVGGTLGGAGGMWAGAALGASVGTAIPIVGTVIGGAIGGTLGSLAGGWAGTESGHRLGRDWKASMKSGKDNRAAVAASAVGLLQAAGQRAVTELFDAIKAAAITRVEARAEALRQNLEQFATTLQNEVRSNG